MKDTQLQMDEINRNEIVIAHKDSKRFCKKFEFPTEILKKALADGWKKRWI